MKKADDAIGLKESGCQERKRCKEGCWRTRKDAEADPKKEVKADPKKDAKAIRRKK